MEQSELIDRSASTPEPEFRIQSRAFLSADHTPVIAALYQHQVSSHGNLQFILHLIAPVRRSSFIHCIAHHTIPYPVLSAV
jgi:hypothetical protein